VYSVLLPGQMEEGAPVAIFCENRRQGHRFSRSRVLDVVVYFELLPSLLCFLGHCIQRSTIT